MGILDEHTTSMVDFVKATILDSLWFLSRRRYSLARYLVTRVASLSSSSGHAELGRRIVQNDVAMLATI